MDESSSPPPGGDAELIGAIASGDTAAYVTLHERHVAAARSLARQLVKSPAEAEEIITETFTRLHAVLRRGGGPDAAVRPYLLTAVRRVAGERSGGQRAETVAGPAETAGLGEPLSGDPAAAELESEPMARAFLSLPERQRAVLWHTVIEPADPGQAAAVLGVTATGVAELGEQARAGLARAYLKLYLSGRTRQDCRSAAGKLDLHLSRAGRRPDEGKVQRHLRGCRDCRAVAVELTGLSRSLRHVVAPIFLGPATQAYLAAAEARAASPGRTAVAASAAAAGGLRRMRQAPRRIRQAPRPRLALAGGGLLLATSAVTGLALTLAANTGAPHAVRGPAAGSPGPAVAVPLPLPAPARTGPPAAAPAPARSATPVSSGPLVPAAAISPAPSPLPSQGRHHRRHHHHGDPDQASAQ